MRLTKALIPSSLSLLLIVTGVAQAETQHVEDPAGNGLKGRALDITTVKVANRDHAIVTKVSFVRAAHGDLYVRFLARGEKRRTMAAVGSIHRARGDKNRLLTIDGVQECKGLRVSWDHESDYARIRVPSHCLLDGDYGAVKTKVITEIGSDADLAPKDESGNWRWTGWVSRG
jgi:hypothetical protein